MKIKRKKFPVSLTIAGSDSGGGAGIQADLRTFSALGVFGTSVVSSVTAQNPSRVKAVMPLSAKIVEAQLDAVFSRIAVRSVKTGMLFDSSIIKTVSAFLRKKTGLVLVVDPVMISSSGAFLLRNKALKTLKDELFPLADWLTPNVQEAELILDRKILSFEDSIAAAKKISSEWGCSCVVKGGHRLYKKKMRLDIVAAKKCNYLISGPDIGCSNHLSHGTGCTFSAALVANFAKEMNDSAALRLARAFVHNSLLRRVNIGRNINAMFPPEDNNLKDILICKL